MDFCVRDWDSCQKSRRVDLNVLLHSRTQKLQMWHKLRMFENGAPGGISICTLEGVWWKWGNYVVGKFVVCKLSKYLFRVTQISEN
jgi:hypothetical protein